MGYEADLIASGRCAEIVLVDTEDGPVTGRCEAPIVTRFVVSCEDGRMRHEGTFETRAEADRWAQWGHCCTSTHEIEATGFACAGHTEQIIGWRQQSEAETIVWERRQDECGTLIP